MRKSAARWAITGAAVAALLALAVPAGLAVDAAPAASDAPSAGRPAPAIRVVAAERRELVERLEVTGTVLPRQEAQVGVDLNGMLVAELRADRGDRVKAGDVLAVLDRSMLDTQLAQADANRAQAEANVAQQRAQIADADVAVRQALEGLERARELQKKGVAAKAQLDNAVNAHDSALARRLAAEKAVAAAEAQLAVIDAQKSNILVQIGKTEVRAPADGLVLARNATLGAAVMPGGAALFRIAVDGEFELAARVPEAALPRLAPGMPVSVRLAGHEQAARGQIRMIEPEIDQTLRMGTIRVALPDDAGARAGNFAQGSIELVRRDGVAVPASALVYRDREAFLQTVADGVVVTVPVTVGARADGFVEIVEGLRQGDEVVSRAGTFVADGDRVTPVRGVEAGALSR